MSAVLNGKLRKETGKSASRKLRRDHHLPAVLYGRKDNLSFSLDPKDLTRILQIKGQSALIDLSIEGDSTKKRKVVLKDYQTHPLREGWVHADFLEVDLEKKIRVSVPVKLVGHSPGEKLGGLINQITKELDILCFPEDIPEAVEVNMEEVELDQVLHVSDLSVLDKVEILAPPNQAVVNVFLQKAEEEKPAEGEEVPVEGVVTEAPEAAEGEPEKKD